MPMPPSSLALASRVVFPFSFAYFVSYLTRVVNSVIAPELTAELGLDAADLGLLTSVYFLVFAAFQIPLGILLDRFGPRRTNAALLTFAAGGALVFANADNMLALTLGRGLIGLGVSGCLMSSFTAYRAAFTPDRLPLVSGIQMAAGGFGALMGTVPVEAALAVGGWRGVFVGFAAIIVAAALTIMAVVPKDAQRADRETLRQQMRGIGAIFRSPLFIRIAPLTVASQGTFVGVQSLWIGPWLADVAGLDRTAVAGHLSFVAAAMIAGFLAWGWLAGRMGRRGIRPISVGLYGMTMFQVTQLCSIVLAEADGALAIWVAFGFFGTANVLCYATVAQAFPAEMAGRVNTALNLLVFTGAFAAQWGVGALINRWPPLADGAYPVAAYQAASAALLALQIAAIAWYALYRRNEIKL